MRTKRFRHATVLTVAALCASLLTACPHRGEGPAERVGKSMDKGAAAVGHGIEKTGQAIEGAAGGR